MDRTQILKNVQDGIKGRFPLYNLGFGHDVDLNFLEVMSLENNGRVQRIYEDHDATQQLQVSSPTAPPLALLSTSHLPMRTSLTACSRPVDSERARPMS